MSDPADHPDPKNPPALEAEHFFQRAYEAQMQGHLDTAVQLYRRSIDCHPTAKAHTFLGWAYSFQGKTDAAIRECMIAIQIDPEFGNPYNDIGAYLIEKGEWEQAIPWFQKAIFAKDYEARHYPHYNLSRVYEHLNRPYEAIDELKRAISANPDYTLARRDLNRLLGKLN